jgi:glycosyltransferase XagB
MTALAAWAMVAVSLALFGVAMATLWWMLHAWRDPETLGATGFERTPGPPELSFSLIVPARHEESVLAETLAQLARSDHPRFEVLVVVGHDDPETAAVAHAATARDGERIRVVVDHGSPKNKPRALNAALPHCRGEIVGVFDAEDEVDRRLLRSVDGAFRATGADVVQGGVQLMNFRSSWYALRNCLEYFFWFRSRLHLHQRHGFIPLGGNTVFVRAALLRAVGGWDPDCLAEDCELGVRLSVRRARIAVAYDPHLVTREETPDTLLGLVRQRTRWNQGFLQVLRKGEWRALARRRERLLARYTLCQPFLQAFAGVTIPLAAITALMLRAPVGLALLTFLPAMPTAAMLVFELVGLREFCRIYYVRPRVADYARLLLGAPLYQLVLAGAACRAVVRELRGQRGWEKTAHSGAHRREPAAAGTGDSPRALEHAQAGA